MAKPVKRKLTDSDLLARRNGIDAIAMGREAARAKTTRKLAGFDYIRGDLHMHTVYSDGSGSVADMEEIADFRGLDFIFVTDHSTIRQSIECRKYKNVWWGQEPGAGPQHVCILAGKKKYTPLGDMARDAERLRELGQEWGGFEALFVFRRMRFCSCCRKKRCFTNVFLGFVACGGPDLAGVMENRAHAPY